MVSQHHKHTFDNQCKLRKKYASDQVTNYNLFLKTTVTVGKVTAMKRFF